jgi:hypothetical protein
MLYMPVTAPFNGQPQVAPHTLIAGSTGSGKGILAANLILDLCAFDSPTACRFYLIDPKQGADYMWAEDLPHLQERIIVEMDEASRVFGSLVTEMEERYRRIAVGGAISFSHSNTGRPSGSSWKSTSLVTTVATQKRETMFDSLWIRSWSLGRRRSVSATCAQSPNPFASRLSRSAQTSFHRPRKHVI